LDVEEGTIEWKIKGPWEREREVKNNNHNHEILVSGTKWGHEALQFHSLDIL